MISVIIRGSLLQLATPPEMRGRVSAVNSLFIGASNELGEFESGLDGAVVGRGARNHLRRTGFAGGRRNLGGGLSRPAACRRAERRGVAAEAGPGESANARRRLIQNQNICIEALGEDA